jgi:hypothetical protein
MTDAAQSFEVVHRVNSAGFSLDNVVNNQPIFAPTAAHALEPIPI